jgi:hypothetical protein
MHDPFELELLENGADSVLEPLPEIHRYEEPWIDKFLYDRYDWTNFKASYGVIMLNRRYFMMVDKRSLKRFQRAGKWTVDIRYDRDGNFIGAYAVSRIDGKIMYAHRFAVHAAKGEYVDHANGYGLDDRLCNLRPTTQSFNIGGNAMRRDHTKHLDLPPGVARIQLRSGKIRFRAQIQVRGKVHYSRRFDTPEAPAAWYQKMHKKLFPIRAKAWLATERREPIFPPERKTGDEFHPLPVEIPKTNGHEIPF